ncbi:MAG: Tn3 family transposase, partial [Gammaproteobacteria bacterium]|nr:Tn3 family transposase [Gammaproteobacteria bacterium]
MPRRSLLSAVERESLLAIPENDDELIRQYTLNEVDLALVRQRRGDPNRLGIAVQLCLLRYPGQGLLPGADVPAALLHWLGRQLRVDPDCWPRYAEREETRREHLLEVRAYLGLVPFGLAHYRKAVQTATAIALQSDKGVVLASGVMDELRRERTVLPGIEVIERACVEGITRANRRIYAALSEPLSDAHRRRLDGLLKRRDNGKSTWLTWLRQSPAKPNSRHMLEHIERLKGWQALDLPAGIELRVHQNRLLKMAREGGQMTPADLAKFEPNRRYATLVAVAIESMATVVDEVIDLHDRILGRLFGAAKNKHQQQFQAAGKAINENLRLFGRVGQALLDAKQIGIDAFAAIENAVGWEAFAESVREAQRLSQPEDFDFLHLVGDQYSTLRRYAPEFLRVLKLRAAPAAKGALDAIELLRRMNATGARTVPSDAPTAFIKKRWEKLVVTGDGLDRRYYELCAMSELKNALRSGDIWAQGSRQFKDFDEYLVPTDTFTTLKRTSALPLAVEPDCERYLSARLRLLDEQLETANRLAASNELPAAIITTSGLKITPLDAVVPDAAQALIDQIAMRLPHVKVTELLLEVDAWTGFTRHFTHLKSGDGAKDKTLLLTAVLADAINLGLSKMAESCPGVTYAKLSWLQAWHIRDETYSAALAELVNAQFRQPFAEHWGDGTTSSSDGQRFRAGGKAESTGHINPKYGSDPGRQFYTHISDQYAPFHTKVINVGIRDSTYVLDGLLYHESDLRIEEHYTDTAGFTDHVFALMHLLGFRFAPRIRDLGDTRLYVPSGKADYSVLKPMIGGTLNSKLVRAHWDEILRLATSIKQGTVTASLMLRKLGSYPRQNGLAVALRELGRIERTLFILDWLQ